MFICDRIPCFSEGELGKNFEGLNDFILSEEDCTKNLEMLINGGNGPVKLNFLPLVKFFIQTLELKTLSNEQKCIAYTGLLEACLVSAEFSEAIDKFDTILKLTHGESQPVLHMIPQQ
jgi:hypothetical protein